MHISESTSVLYNGGGASNALKTLATDATLVAGGEAVISVEDNNIIEIWLMNSTASQSGVLLVVESSIAVPTVLTTKRFYETAIAVGDQTCTVDRAKFGLVTGTEYAPKSPIRIAVNPASFLQIAMASSLGGVWYARYTLLRG